MEEGMRRPHWKTAAFWTATGAFAGMMLLSASMYLSGAQAIRDAFVHLGFPAYLLIILGVAKALGAVALVQNRAMTLREWAYAGFTINLIGAIASHLFSGDGIQGAMAPGAFLAVLAVSYALRPGHASFVVTAPELRTVEA
jgi:hypothetical protein